MPGRDEEITTAPQPIKTSQKVPKNSARYFGIENVLMSKS
jgi:hypothetical protein